MQNAIINPYPEFFAVNRSRNSSGVNTLFGGKYYITQINRSRNPISTRLSQDSAPQVEDMILRDTGLYKKIKKNDTILKALRQPGQYINERTVKLRDEANALVTVFNREYLKYLNRGYTQERAKKLAMEEVQHQKKKSYEEIDEEYPTKIDDRVLPKMGVKIGKK